jgi:hypothetical protein
MTDLHNKELGLNIFNALIKNEELLSKLYGLNSNLFPVDSEFWIDISKDEMVHASWLSELSTFLEQGNIVLGDERFDLDSINKFGSDVTDQINIANKGTITAIKALTTSMDLENSMLESDIFKVYDTDDDELKVILNRLHRSTEVHYSEIKERWLVEQGEFDQE